MSGINNSLRIVFLMVIVTVSLIIRSYWQITYHSKIQTRIIPRDHSYLIKNCSITPTMSDNNAKTILLIKSVIYRLDRRQAIRSTWAHNTVLKETQMARIFLLALSNNTIENAQIKNESMIFGDILVVDYIDQYRTVLKKMLAGFNFILRSNINFTYVLVTDDDVFLNTRKIFNDVQMLPMKRNLTELVLVCAIYKGGLPFRDPRIKYYVTLTEYAPSIYPSYCAGNFYMVTRQLAQYIYWQVVSGPYKLHIDDVLMTGVVLENEPRVTRIDWKHYSREYNSIKDLADPWNVIYIHGLSPGEIRDTWQTLNA